MRQPSGFVAPALVGQAVPFYCCRGVARGSGDPGAAIPSSGQGEGGLAGWLGNTEELGAPKAFLNYYLFDGLFNQLDAGFRQVTKSAAITADRPAGAHEKLVMEVDVQQAGYLFTNLSFDGDENVEVYFDDFTIVHEHGNIVQVQDYYPYGMPFNTKMAEHTVLNRYLYQGKELQDSTGWYDFHARQYSSQLGRFLGIDPQGQFANPYNGMGNNPVMRIDPNGEFAFLIALGVGLVSGYISGRAAGLRGTDLFGYTFATGIIGTLSAGIGSGVAAGVGATVGGAYGGLIGAAAGGVVGGAIGGFYGTALNGGNPLEGAWKGAVSGLAGGTIGSYVAGGAGALLGGAIGSGTNAALNSGDFGDIGMAALIGGGVSFGTYWGAMYSGWARSGKEYSWAKYRKLSYMAQKSFARGREWGAWETSDDVILDKKMGTRGSTTQPTRPEGAIARWHTHPNWGKGWVESFSPAFLDPATGEWAGDLYGIRFQGTIAQSDFFRDEAFLKLRHAVIGRQNTYMTSTWAVMNNVDPYKSSYNPYYRYPYYPLFQR